MKYLFLLVCFFIIFSYLNADQTAFTSDGRKVLLKDNGNWEYIDEGDNAEPQSAINNGALFKVLQIKDNVKSKAFFTPEENMRILALEVLIDNTNGKSDLEFNFVVGIGFELKDNTGYSYEITIASMGIIKPEFPDTIESGDIGRGWIGFEIQKNVAVSDLRIRYINRYDNIKSGWIFLHN